MFNKYQDLAIECWQQAGPRLGVADRALCLRANAADAIRTFAAIVDEIAKLPVPVRRTLTLRPTGRKEGCTTIRIVLLPQGDDLHEMSVTRLGKIATFEFTPAGLQNFRGALDRWQEGAEDFSIHSKDDRDAPRDRSMKGPQTAEIWFWRGMEP